MIKQSRIAEKLVKREVERHGNSIGQRETEMAGRQAEDRVPEGREDIELTLVSRLFCWFCECCHL